MFFVVLAAVVILVVILVRYWPEVIGSRIASAMGEAFKIESPSPSGEELLRADEA